MIRENALTRRTDSSITDACEWLTANLAIHSTIGEISDYTDILNLDDAAQKANACFEADPRLPGILIEDHNQILGLLSRQRFFEVMSRPYSLELFMQRPLRSLWRCLPQQTLVLDAELPITDAVQQALQRDAKDTYEPIVVQHSPQHYSILDIYSLLLAQSIIHTLTLEELKRNKQALSEEKDLAQITLKSIADGVITSDSSGDVLDINPIAEKLTNYSREAAIGQPVTEVFHPLDEHSQEPIPHPVTSVIQNQQPIYSQKTVLLRTAKSDRDIQYSTSPIFNKKNQFIGTILVFRDVTRQQKLLRRIHWQACHDALTGLTNRVEFEAQLSSRIHESLQGDCTLTHVLIYLDLDRFKVVNDTCGHFAGDELLRQVGALLQSCLCEDDMLARLGGDEFGILLRNCNLYRGKQIVDHIYCAIQNFKFIWQDYAFTIGVSIGMTLVKGDVSASEVLKQADSACYVAKHQGRNQIYIYEDMSTGVMHPAPSQLVNRITYALTHSEFSLFHQNIYSIAPGQSSTLFASEILIRLPDGEDSWVRPDAFLSTAERYNLMTEIDRWVVQTFCESYHQVYASMQPVFFSINLSGSSLNSDRLLTFICAQLEANRIPPESICFEITETIAIANLTQARKILQALKNLGCYLALDDFGSGMSSFHYLRTLPVNYLKIDGSLVRDIVCDRVAREMVAAIINIGHEMGLKTIAEWVENEQVAAVLTELNNDYMQGFALHQPELLG